MIFEIFRPSRSPHLADICKQEKTAAEPEALLLVAKSAAGSMRDGLSLLERLLSSGREKLTPKVVEEVLGLPRGQSILELAECIGNADAAATLKKADEMMAGGMSADSLVAALADHLRNCLILRTCGSAGDLVEAPSVDAEELKKQAEKFDPIALTQDIPILEDLRRQMRQGFGGRALLDATLVRLALAAQFTAIGDLLNRVDSGAGAGAASPTAPAAQKKKLDEPVEVKSASHPVPLPPPQSIPPRPSPPPRREESRIVSPPPAPAARTTPAVMAEVEQDPLVRAVIQELDGRVVKVE